MDNCSDPCNCVMEKCNHMVNQSTQCHTNDEHETTECSICMEALDSKNIAVMDCGHHFHYKCIFKWNLTQEGDRCPLCREDLDLPESCDSSSYSVSNGDENENENENENDSDSSIDIIEPEENETEYQQQIRESLIGEKRRKAITFLIESQRTHNRSDLVIKCTECNHAIVTCNFCTEPFCVCQEKEHLSHIKPCPFSKFYNSVYDTLSEDDEFISLMQPLQPNENRKHAHVCDRCFVSRDYVLWVALRYNESSPDSLNNSNEIRLDRLESNEIKTIYYHLFHDNSGIDNTSIYEEFRNFTTFYEFQRYVVDTYILQNSSTQYNPQLEHDEDVNDISESTEISDLVFEIMFPPVPN